MRVENTITRASFPAQTTTDKAEQTRTVTTFDADKTERWMLRNVGSFIDCGEVQCTQLAEAAAYHFGIEHVLTNPDHEIWDLAVDVSTSRQAFACL